jgi:hypothetical protein
VLSFVAELVLDGCSLPRPVNYGLVRIVPLYFSLTTMTTTGYGDIVPVDPFARSGRRACAKRARQQNRHELSIHHCPLS